MRPATEGDDSDGDGDGARLGRALRARARAAHFDDRGRPRDVLTASARRRRHRRRPRRRPHIIGATFASFDGSSCSRLVSDSSRVRVMKPKLSCPQLHQRIQPLRTSFPNPPPTFRRRPAIQRARPPLPPPSTRAIDAAVNALAAARRVKAGNEAKTRSRAPPSRTRATPALIKCAALALNARPQRAPSPSPTLPSSPPARSRSPAQHAATSPI
jgi:hypothetical protein